MYRYERGYLNSNESYSNGSNGGRTVKESINHQEHSKRAQNRAKNLMRRIINANHGQYPGCSTKFLTLTFREHITEVEQANHEFKKFIKRLNYKFFDSGNSNLRYLAVPEYTKKGRIHFHVVLFNLPFIRWKMIEDTWKNGFIKINRCEDVTNLGAYVSKYITKESNQRLKGKKRYFCSRNLFKPVELINEEAGNLLENLPEENKTYQNTFENEYVGKVDYEQYIIKKQ